MKTPESIGWRAALLAPGVSRPAALAAGLAAAVVFVAVASLRLTAQGLYYDELHQATGAFAYTGQPPPPPRLFAVLCVEGIPVLNMPYTGAIKTGLYGLYLRVTGAQFSVVSWRALGILFTALGIFVFCPLARRAFSPLGLIVFLLLVVSDLMVVVGSRHDWGPIALALLLRFLLIGTWLHGETAPTLSRWNTFTLGLLTGVAVFEKLSSVVLLGPVLAMVGLSPRRRSAQHRMALLLGGLVGSFPLLAVNAYGLYHFRTLPSLQDYQVPHPKSLGGFLTYAQEYLALGQGETIRYQILGDTSGTGPWEAALLGLTVLSVVILALRRGRGEPSYRLAGVAALSYACVAVLLYLLPRPATPHHWIIGTPFQYLALTLPLTGRPDVAVPPRRSAALMTAGLLVLAALLLAARVPAFASTVGALARGDATLMWDPSLTALGEQAARRQADAAFIAADWGVETQIYCFAGGRPDSVYPLFWNYRGPEELGKTLAASRKNTFYLIGLKEHSGVSRTNTARLWEDAGRLPNWEEVPVEDELASLRAVLVRKFVSRGAGRPAPE
jgi:hypothetical protein